MLNPEKVRCIQVYHLNQIGDFLFSLPLLASLRQAFPNARLVSVLRPGLVDLWKMSGLGHDYIVRPKGRGAVDRLRLVSALRRRRPDLAVVIAQSYEPPVLAWLSGARIRIGFRPNPTAFLLTHKIRKNTPPSIANNLLLLSELGITPGKTDYIGLIRPLRGEVHRMHGRLEEAGVQSGDDLVILSPGASAKRAVKEWDNAKFARVADHFNQKQGVRVAVVGTVSADELIRQATSPVLDFTCSTTLTELAALLERATLFIGVDSGTLHLAGALAVPLVGIYGPTDHTLTGPPGPWSRIVRTGIECSPCRENYCRIQTRECMENLPESLVIEAAEDLWQMIKRVKLASQP